MSFLICCLELLLRKFFFQKIPQPRMESEIDNRCWKLRPDVVATVLNDGAVMLDLESKFFFSANSTAWAIAEMFESGATQSEVHEACARWGAVNGDRLLIDEVIRQMVAEGLVKPADTPG